MAVDAEGFMEALAWAFDLDEEFLLLGGSMERCLESWGSLAAILRGQSGPPKLCIDGHEYHRRQRRRTKRNRR